MTLDIFVYGLIVSSVVGAAMYFVSKIDAPG